MASVDPNPPSTPPIAGDPAWVAVRHQADIQFAPLPPSPPHPATPPPGWWAWLNWFGNGLARLIVTVTEHWLAATVILVLALVVVVAWRMRQQRRPATAPQAPVALPPAPLDPLAEAEAEAALGAYDRALHRLLLGAVSWLAAARPGVVGAASTARELIDVPGLASAIHAALATLAREVERARYALEPADAAAWQRARAAWLVLAQEPGR